MDEALYALTRRALLDGLRQRNWQSLSDLKPTLSMSWFGVMKHLRVLEDAHLIVTQPRGRFD